MQGWKGTALITTGQRWTLFLHSALLENVVQKQLIAMALLLRCAFFVCSWDSESACYLCSPRVFYRTGISMQDHTVRNTLVGPVHQTNCIHRWRTRDIFRVFVGNMQKSLLIATFVLNAESSKYTLVGGKSPNQNSLSGIMISLLGRSDG